MVGRAGKRKGKVMSDHFEMRVLLNEYGDVCLRGAGTDIREFGVRLSDWLKKVSGNHWANSDEMDDFLEKKKAITAETWQKLTTCYKDDERYQSFLKDYLNNGEEPYVIENFRIDLKSNRLSCPVDYHFLYMVNGKSVVISRRDGLPLCGTYVVDIPLEVSNLDRAYFIKQEAMAKLDWENKR